MREMDVKENERGPDAGGLAKVEARGFSFFYGKVQALKSLDLSIPENSLLTIMGPTASGKTTFLKALNRLNDRVQGTNHTGSLFLGGHDVYDKDVDVANLRRRVGMVFAQPVPLPMSIYENVAFGPRKRGVSSRKRLDEIVEKALVSAAIWDEVKDRLDSPAQNLSGGQQQRLSLARVLAVEPEVVLLDEPTSGLDPISTLRIEELLRDLSQRYTVILVTHNPVQAARVQGEVAFFYMGELVEKGPAASMFVRPKDKRTEDYITGKFG
jgi:phosphate transport system ATP-binding protein